MKKIINKNVLKLIAVVTMLIDHIGWIFYPNIVIFRIIGRLAFPIYAFSIADGVKHTRNRKKYILNILIFAIISQVPYYLLTKKLFRLNILFSFLISLLLITYIEKLRKNESIIYKICLFVVAISLIILTLLAWFFDILPYGMLGIVLVLAFYFIKDEMLRNILAVCILFGMSVVNCLKFGWNFTNISQAFSIISILIICFYNNKKGKINLKYLFYFFYPVHLLIIYLLTLII